MALTELAVKNAKPKDKPYKLSDGGGLFLLVQINGGKYWRLAYRFADKQKTLALGIYPDISLADARERREQARKLLANDTDPSAIKKETKRILQTATVNSFSALAKELHKVKAPMWTEGHAKQWMLNMEKYAFPVIGDRPVAEIEPLELVGIMRNVEAQGTFETRDRLLQTISSTFKYAIAIGKAKYNPAEIRLALADRPKVENFACLSTDEIPAFLRAFDDYQERGKVSLIAVAAFRLLLLTATRSSEVRFSKWADFDLDAGCWIIPAEQTGRKGKHGKRKPHAVPLSDQAIAVLRDLYPVTGHGEHVFPSRNGMGRVISENTVNKIIETMGYKGRQTGHGFRSLARTTLGDMGHRWEVLEAMLSHALENQTAAAYVRTTYFEERRGIMQKWADYLDAVKSGAQVIPLRA
ncbi:tyrosine-type recombinase/integrase [Gallionella capsiferriformans]|uniref:Integrase family protein n=1 Tax=Gallionella capsiferriformans (strain ES-2) TaxID=395494 RepID=D9SH40_GALCS|nr:integrase arm-type DNA-binding domain-containing protein [Gallionella capsiferriformans]ADL55837.1 integrase family protein [Gallionella capsiferriformans ES-2]